MGLEFRDGAVHLNPRIPAELRHLRMKLQVRGSRLEVVAKPRAITIARESVEDGEVMIGYLDERYALMPGGALNIDLPEPA